MMTPEQVTSIFTGIDDFTKERIVRNLKPELSSALSNVSIDLAAHCKKLGVPVNASMLIPQPNRIFEAFRRCSLQHVRVVMISDKPTDDSGLAFNGAFTNSICACLIHHGLMEAAPAKCDLRHWADQGVLLLNTTLTSIARQSHSTNWKLYSDALVKQISELPQRIIFIMLGKHAQKRFKLISSRHVKLFWGHPSSISANNRDDNPLHFKYCDAFTKTNQLLTTAGETPIDWGFPLLYGNEYLNVYEGPPTEFDVVPDVPLYVFVAAGVSQKNDIIWAFYATDGKHVKSATGIMPGSKLIVYSAYRGELVAISSALCYLSESASQYDRICIISNNKSVIKAMLSTGTADEVLSNAKYYLQKISVVSPTGILMQCPDTSGGFLLAGMAMVMRSCMDEIVAINYSSNECAS